MSVRVRVYLEMLVDHTCGTPLQEGNIKSIYVDHHQLESMQGLGFRV